MTLPQAAPNPEQPQRNNNNNSDNHNNINIQKQSVPLSEESVSGVKWRLWKETAKGLLGHVLLLAVVPGNNLREAWYTGTDAVFYSREEGRFKKYIPPFRYGLMASVFLFVNFRITGSKLFREWSKGGIWWKKAPTLKQAPPIPRQRPTPTPTLTHPMKQPPPVGGALEKSNQVQKGRGATSSKSLLTDALISLGVGISGTLFLLESKCREDFRDDYETAPLVAGRSFLAEKMCPGMLELYRSDPSVRNVLEGHAKHKDNTKSYNGETTTHDPGLATFATFIENCKRRANHEAKLRKERNGTRSENDSVLIPHTGVQ